MKRHVGILLQGLAVVVPVVFTAWILYATIALIDRWMVRLIGDPAFWFTGAGTILALAVIYVVGLLTRLYLFQSLLGLAERMIGRVPLVKTLYGSVRDLLQFFEKGTATRPTGKAVRVDVGPDAHMIGITTTEDQSGERVGVYFPLSYQIGGYLVYMPTSRLRRLDMDVESALKLVLTGGMGTTTDISTMTDIPIDSDSDAPAQP